MSTSKTPPSTSISFSTKDTQTNDVIVTNTEVSMVQSADGILKLVIDGQEITDPVSTFLSHEYWENMEEFARMIAQYNVSRLCQIAPDIAQKYLKPMKDVITGVLITLSDPREARHLRIYRVTSSNISLCSAEVVYIPHEDLLRELAKEETEGQESSMIFNFYDQLGLREATKMIHKAIERLGEEGYDPIEADHLVSQVLEGATFPSVDAVEWNIRNKHEEVSEQDQQTMASHVQYHESCIEINDSDIDNEDMDMFV